MPTRVPTWAVISSAPLDALEEVAHECHPGEDFEPWQIRVGTAGLGALLEYEPGTEPTGEEVAKHLSGAHPGKHYVLYFHEDWPWVAVFERGAQRAEIHESPYAVAERLGLPMEATPPAAPDPSRDPMNALIVENRSPEAVAAALDLPAAGGAGLHFDAVTRGTYVRPDGPEPRVGGWAYDLSKNLGARVYTCHWFPREGELLCNVYENGKKVARFESPTDEEPDPLKVESILGEKTREGILRALGIPWVVPRA